MKKRDLNRNILGLNTWRFEDRSFYRCPVLMGSVSVLLIQSGGIRIIANRFSLSTHYPAAYHLTNYLRGTQSCLRH